VLHRSWCSEHRQEPTGRWRKWADELIRRGWETVDNREPVEAKRDMQRSMVGMIDGERPQRKLRGRSRMLGRARGPFIDLKCGWRQLPTTPSSLQRRWQISSTSRLCDSFWGHRKRAMGLDSSCLGSEQERCHQNDPVIIALLPRLVNRWSNRMHAPAQNIRIFKR